MMLSLETLLTVSHLRRCGRVIGFPNPGAPTPMRLTSSHHRTLILLLGCLLPFAASAQTPASPPQSTTAPQQTTPTLRPNPMTQLQAMEPPANEEYQLGGGDEITLEFAGRPDISGKHIIGPDGRITLPMAGAITLAGLTREQAAQSIDQAMSKFYTNISCIVGVDKYGSNRVLVTGYVEHPGIMYFDQPRHCLRPLRAPACCNPRAPATPSTILFPSVSPSIAATMRPSGWMSKVC